MPANRVTHVVETPTGVVWAGTSGGLAHYDGFHWFAVGSADGLPTGTVQSLSATASERVLVVIDGRLYRGDRSGFEPIPIEDGGRQLDVEAAVPFGDEATLIQAWTPDRVEGRLFVRRRGAVQPLPAPARIPGRLVNQSNVRIWTTRRGVSWLSTFAGLYRFQGDAWELVVPAGDTPFLVSSVDEDHQGMGIATVGAPSPARSTAIWEWFDDAAPRPCENMHGERVRSVAISDEDMALVVYQWGGVGVRKERLWTLVDKPPRPFEAALSVKFRSTGDLWVGTEQGLYLWKRGADRWTHWSHPVPDPRNWIHEIIRAGDGAIWIATADGIEVIQPDGRKESIDQIDAEPLGIVTGLAEDDAGGIWLTSGATFTGAFRRDGSQWERVDERQGLVAANFHKIRKDRAGRLWFLGLANLPSPFTDPAHDNSETTAGGAVCLDGDRFVRYGKAEGLIDDRVYDFVEGTDGALWFATMRGISRKSGDRWTHWTSDRGLKCDRIFTVELDQRNRLWFGDQENGLGFIDGDDPPRYLTEADGLANDCVWDLALAVDGTLWITTDGGLSTYRDGVLAKIGAESGLCGSYLWPVALIDDRVFLGTRGHGTYALSLQEREVPPPRVVIARLISERQTAYVRWHAASYWGQIAPGDIETRYRLNDGPWSRWSTGRELRLHDLSATTHHLDVQAKGLFGGFDPAGATVSFAVEAPFYQRPIFLIVITGLATSIAVLVVGLALRRSQFESALRESQEWLQAILDNTAAVIYVKDVKGHYLLVNRRYADLFHTGDVVRGKTDFDVFPRHLAEAFRKNDLEVLERGHPVEFEEVARHDDGDHTYISLKFPLLDATGEPKALCGVSTDITERKRAAEELQKAKDAAESANRTKSVFLANMSHEIRTPITAVLGAAELAHADAAGRLRPDLADVIIRNGRHLLALIDDLLDLCRVEAGRLEVHRVPCSLVDVIADVQAVTTPIHQREDIDFRFIYETDVPERILTDPTRLKQAVINLINNALRFTVRGHVRVRIAVDRDGPEPRVAVRVEDTGPGIASNDIDRIFETFSQIEPKSGVGYAGVGLGLPLVRWIAEQLGGCVEVDSQEGRGSVFTLRVSSGPLDGVAWVPPAGTEIAAAEAGAATLSPPPRQLHGSILLAEDFEDTCELIEKALTAAGARVVAVKNGRAAVEAAASESFDLVLMDVRMPEMDGLTATRELRRRGCRMPIIALTASTSESDRDRVLEAGYDDMWTKPITLDTLVRRSTAYLRHADADADAKASTDGESRGRTDTIEHRLSSAIRQFARNLPERIDRMKSAIDAADHEAVHEILHQLVGTAGVLGFMELSGEAARLLRRSRDGTAPRDHADIVRLEQLVEQALARTGEATGEVQ